IGEAFAGARRSGRRAALMPYAMGGYPTRADSLAIGEAMIACGADLIELGLPYSDPLADGPVIHQAASAALAGGATLASVLELAHGLSEAVPVVLMGYANMVFAPGIQSFVERLARAGLSGLIVPDLPLEEAGQLRAVCDAHGIALVPLVAPTTSPGRLAAIGEHARGFLYAVSVVGTTGERDGLRGRFADVVARAKASTEVPVAVGFGVSTAQDAAAAAGAGADGVIIGTRLVRAAGEPGDPADSVAAALAGIAAGLRAG
ncbi:MAG: tryptophan synthase subunit alpha, partial [Acidobacteriota bacterium]|nr:tryptophan synthase subunit alpha [Acidobacteriota bacterium]